MPNLKNGTGTKFSNPFNKTTSKGTTGAKIQPRKSSPFSRMTSNLWPSDGKKVSDKKTKQADTDNKSAPKKSTRFSNVAGGKEDKKQNVSAFPIAAVGLGGLGRGKSESGEKGKEVGAPIKNLPNSVGNFVKGSMSGALASAKDGMAGILGREGNTAGTGKEYINLEQMQKMGWKDIHCGYTNVNTGMDSPSNDMTSEIARKHRATNQEDVDKINDLFDQFEINSKERITAFFAECSAETSNGFKFLETAGTTDKPLEGPATRENVNKWFDDNKKYGSKYRGAGAVQLTWDYQYDDFEKWMEEKRDKSDPEITNQGAEYVAMNYPWEAAAYFWDVNNLNEKADTNNIHNVTAVVNEDMSDSEYKLREDAYKEWNEKYEFPY